jgi:hypothetical protein
MLRLRRVSLCFTPGSCERPHAGAGALYLILAGLPEHAGERVKAVPSLVLAHTSQRADRFSTAQAQQSSRR